jgi:hypothetical protein
VSRFELAELTLPVLDGVAVFCQPGRASAIRGPIT